MVTPKTRRRLRCAAGILVVLLLLLAVAIWKFWAGRHASPSQLLDQVVRIESEGVGGQNVQHLGWNLAILGRDDEVRQLDFHPQFDFPPLDVKAADLELNVVPWRDGIKHIASENRIVMMMESHFVSKHREMIGATLPVLHDAGFTHYAAEAIGESGTSLTSRGYPVVATGYYTSDPQFGNVIRKAIDLEFEILGYDYRPFTHEMREEYAATELARVIQGDPKSKLVVHAGHAHVLKHETAMGLRWLAAILWEKTGIEPYCIWQWSAMRDGHEHRVVAAAIAELGDFAEPILLIPPPNSDSGLRNVPRVDAILVHPPDQSVSPSGRTVLFPPEMQRISGHWLTERWPVVIAAYKSGEPSNAIPLDQVMLRRGEQEFVLWGPASESFEIVVSDRHGVIDSIDERNRGSVEVRAQ